MSRSTHTSGARARWLSAALAVTLLACSSEGGPCRVEYGSCEEDGQCAAGTRCGQLRWEYGEGALCERPCEDELDCPYAAGRPGRCIDVNRDGRFACYIDCTSAGVCESGWVCQPIEVRGAISGICLP